MKQKIKAAIGRTHIIETAIREFGQHSYESSSINRICSSGGISKGKLYHYFESKEQLYYEAIKYCFGLLSDLYDTFSVDADLNLEENILDFFKLRQVFWLENMDITDFLAKARGELPENLKLKISDLRSDFTTSRYKPSLAKIFSHFFPDNIELQNRLTEMTWIAIDYTAVGIGLPNYTQAQGITDLLSKQLESFSAIIRIFLYGCFPQDKTQ